MLANIVGFSPSHFMALFKKSMGLAPHQYVIKQRIEKAKELLIKTPTPIAQIAYQIGFADQSHLTRLIVRHTGFTPKKIRDK
jgi:AraC family transcriptional regulator